MLKQKARVFSAGLLMAELGVWTSAFLGAHALRAHSSFFERYGEILPVYDYLPLLLGGLVVWTLHGFATDFGRSQRIRPVFDELKNTAIGSAIVGVAVMTLIFLLKAEANSRLVVGMWTIAASVGVTLLRLSVRSGLHSVRRRGFNYRTLAIAGHGPIAHQVAETVRAHRDWGLRFVGYIAVDGNEAPPHGKVLGNMSEIARIVDQNVIDEVIFAVDSLQLEPFEQALAACEEAGVNTRIVLNFFPHKISRLELDELDGFPMLAFHATSNQEFALLAKRVFDLAVSLAAIVVGAPIFIAVALAVRLETRGPVLFVQRRTGLHGREFDLYKFRSMVSDAEARQIELMKQNEMSGPVFKIKHDPRITRVGRFIRKTSLDEIPQFFNVLFGDMSIVGPRPPIPSEVARYARWQRRRLSVKPGITCIWQVSGRNEVDFETWMKQDLNYIDNWSLWLDLKIFLQTIPAVLFARGAR